MRILRSQPEPFARFWQSAGRDNENCTLTEYTKNPVTLKLKFSAIVEIDEIIARPSNRYVL
jgi:hypothetical protein